MKIYLAARYSRREQMVQVAAELRAVGHEITSRWIAGGHQLSDDGAQVLDTATGPQEVPSAAVDFAVEDLQDVLAADLLIAFTEEPRATHSRGGRHVELGVALGVRAATPINRTRMRIMVVGPRENVFTWLPQVEHFTTWQAAYVWITRGEVFAEDPTLLTLGADPDPWESVRLDLLRAIVRGGDPEHAVVTPEVQAAAKAELDHRTDLARGERAARPKAALRGCVTPDECEAAGECDCGVL